MLNAAEVAAVRAPSTAVRAYPVPVLLMERFEKAATPPTAATLAFPTRRSSDLLVPMATVTLDVSEVTTLPNWSSTDTRTAGLIDAPATVVLGWTVNTRCVVAAGVTLNAA